MDTPIIPEFQGFKKIPRLSRDITISEKIDGTCGLIYIGEDNTFLVGSKSRWITPEQDNHGFARWAYANKEDLLKLGIGYHYGEFWGSGIQRGYGLIKGDKRFSLFNSGRWVKDRVKPLLEKQEYCPNCCYVVPILYQGVFNTTMIFNALGYLEEKGSLAAPGYTDPEGIVIYHIAARQYFKKTIKNDEMHKREIK